jgi:glycosyltransferase involved in cell wall biosynthesis
MDITVIVCTFNRCNDLGRALESIHTSIVPEGISWEVLVVDNNSGDQTHQTIEQFCSRYPGQFRYFFEPRPGKSFALNSGIREAHGNILVFMDDDVTVERTWLQNLTRPLLTGEWLGTGGRIVPEQSFVPPAWLWLEGKMSRYALAPLALFDLGMQAGRLEEPPFGTNMAFRKDAFEKYGEFRTDLGPRPGSEIRGEDTEFGSRILAAGEPLYYEPSAVVQHKVSKDRLQQKYFLKWWFDKGRSDIREYGIPPALRSWGVPLLLFRRLAVWGIRWMATPHPGRRFACKVRVWGKLGEITECWRSSAQQKSLKKECNVQS